MGDLSKAQAIRIVTDCAKDYKENLVNRKYMFVVTDKHKKVSYFEVSFDASNFLHLTGCKVDEKKLSPLKFYERCLDRKLSENDFEFSPDGTTSMKLAVLPMMMHKSLSANTIGSYNHRQPTLYTERLAGGIKGCMGFVKDKASGRYIPNTVLKADIRDYISETFRIIATYRKYKTDENYSEIVYIAKKVDWNTIKYPKEIAGLPRPENKL